MNDGLDDLVTCGDVLDPVWVQHNKQFTISTWIKPSAEMINNVIVGKNADNQRQMALVLGEGGKLVFVWHGVLTGGAFVSTKGNTAITDTSTWYHVVSVYDGTKELGSRVSLCMNGAAEQLAVGTVEVTEHPFRATFGAIDRDDGEVFRSHRLHPFLNVSRRLADKTLLGTRRFPFSELGNHPSVSRLKVMQTPSIVALG